MNSMLSAFLKHPQWPSAEVILNKLHKSGYTAYLAGGCVRDALMGRIAKDLDIATNASPDQVQELFPDHVAVGKSFGVIMVKHEGHGIEVASFRSDGAYIDGRHPSSVVFSNPKEDAERRDFTINALFYDVFKAELIDFVGGQKDISKKLIRAVGDAERRLTEDKLRILRALRFSTELDFQIDKDLYSQIKILSPHLSSLSKERITAELERIFLSENRVKGLSLLFESHCLKAIFPTINILDSEIKFKIYLGLLSRGTSFHWNCLSLLFYMELQNNTSSELANFLDRQFTRVSIANTDKESISFCIQNIDEFAKAGTHGLLLLNHKFGLQLWDFAMLIYSDKRSALEDLRNRFLDLCGPDGKLPMAYINGRDLIERGMKSGPQFGELLEKLYKMQIEGEFRSRSEALIWVTNYLK